MKFKAIIAALAAALLCSAPLERAAAQATLLPSGELCFQATVGLNGMVGLLGSITGGSSYTNGSYGGVPLTGGAGSGATANITVSGGSVTTVAILNPGIQYVVGDVLSASAASIGGTGSGFSVPVASTSINSSLAGGTVGFYFPSTNTPKQTWQNSTQTTLNQNPVPLDANGCAIIYGVGTYRQLLQDSLGNTVWDQLTSSTSPIGIFWAGQAAGTPNAITITDASFAFGDGTAIQFLAFRQNTGPTTISISGGSPISIVKDTSTGPVALSGGEIGPNNAPLITYDQVNAVFHLVNPAVTTSGAGATTSIAPPQGYLNLVGQASGDVIQVGDVVAAATIFYSPFTGNQLPIWNGSSFVLVTFSELTATLTTAGSPLSTIQDECIFSNNGVPTLVTGPSWTTVTAGAGNRGTGAGTAQITRLNGIWVNSNSIIGYNGLSTYTIPANQCTYVGSIQVDATAGQVSAYRTAGQSRKFGIWNAYNRQRIVMQVRDPTVSWLDGGASWHQTNSSVANSLITFTGLPEEEAMFDYGHFVNVGNAAASAICAAAISVGVNSTSVPLGSIGNMVLTTPAGGGFSSQGTVKSAYVLPPTIGTNLINLLSNISINVTATVQPTYYGGLLMLMTAEYKG
jgi:hypothetical protein